MYLSILFPNIISYRPHFSFFLTHNRKMQQHYNRFLDQKHLGNYKGMRRRKSVCRSIFRILMWALFLLCLSSPVFFLFLSSGLIHYSYIVFAFFIGPFSSFILFINVLKSRIDPACACPPIVYGVENGGINDQTETI